VEIEDTLEVARDRSVRAHDAFPARWGPARFALALVARLQVLVREPGPISFRD
jgi:hypothetical protein